MRLRSSSTRATTVLLADVSVFVHAHRLESARASEYARWLEARAHGDEPFGVSEAVLASFVRIVTHHRVYRDPTPPVVALDFCRAVLSAPSVVPVRPGPRHWPIFESLVSATGARGNVIPDAYLAAVAIEHGATWVTDDRGFARFPGLRWSLPLETPAR